MAPNHIRFLTFSQVQGLLTELTAVEEEITWLERRVDELKLSLYREKQQTLLFEGGQLIELQPQWSHKNRNTYSAAGEKKQTNLIALNYLSD